MDLVTGTSTSDNLEIPPDPFVAWLPVGTVGIISPAKVCNTLNTKYNIKLKGDGKLDYHLGCTYSCNIDGTHVADP